MQVRTVQDEDEFTMIAALYNMEGAAELIEAYELRRVALLNAPVCLYKDDASRGRMRASWPSPDLPRSAC